MGLALDCITESQAVAFMMDELERGRGGWAITANLDHLRQFRACPDLRALFAQADLVVADGMPLIWASRIQGTPLPERVAGSELVWSLTAEAALAERTVYLLGDLDEARTLAERRLVTNYPGVRVAGSYSPPLGFENDPEELDAIRARLVAAQPDIVYVALGFPKQEQLIARLRDDLPAAWFIGVGISLSFLGGYVRRAPTWICDLGLEWVHRLIQEPRRLAKRYLVHGLPFGVRLFANAVAVRIRGRRPEPLFARPGHVPSIRRVVFARGALERARAEALVDLIDEESA